ncbi:hypothetical protein JTB14_007272 [Gonioctena quinquepunctata]|nr:hypothetical protein JTB14_007272 [Gonioctena quinquepunctata]
MTTSPGTLRRQKRMGPAPFASFEDLSDEVRSRLESPDDKNLPGSVVRLPGIREDLTPTTPSTTDRAPSPTYLCKGISIIGSTANTYTETIPLPKTPSIIPSTPRIDISRASSSSHHDSSSPEREIFDSADPHSAKLGLGFKEDGALDLRSSTEELDFHEIPERRRSKARPQSPHEESDYVRKDSQCSDIVLLSISGRTSRLSSIGSQGSGQSRLSNASHISIISGQSGISRSSSPHKLKLETSFCGTKPQKTPKSEMDQRGTKHETEVMEEVLLSRKHDPTEAILAEGIEVEKAVFKPPRKTDIGNKISDITITVDKPASESNNSKQLPSRIVAESGVEYIYIPLKGPLPPDLEAGRTPERNSGKKGLREVKSANYQARNAKHKSSNVPESTPRCKSATPTRTPLPSNTQKEEAKCIRIKLKPDNCYSDESPKGEEMHKPDTLELDKIQNSSNYIHENSKLDLIQYSYKEPDEASAPINVSQKKSKDENKIESVSPSPSVSRKSSFASLFKSKEAIVSPESPSAPSLKRKNTITGMIRDVGDNLSTRSRSKSRDTDSHKSSHSTAPSSTESIDTKSKHKSVLSLFKSNKKDKIKSESDNSSEETLPSIEGIGKLEFKFNETKNYHENPLESASIRIPLHSPTFYENRSIDWKNSSQDSQETVIEAPSRTVNVIVEPIQSKENSGKKSPDKPDAVSKNSRQSSTSSENVVFSTKLGNDDEVFTTKLPKRFPTDLKKDDVKTGDMNGIVETKLQNKKTNCRQAEQQQIIDENEVIEERPKENTIPEVGGTKCESTKIGALSTNSIMSSNAEEERNSSESERESEGSVNNNNKKDLGLKLELDVSEPERKAIFLQQDSFEDELPYIPTTLPQERSSAIPIVPIKQRTTFEMKTFPIERPRSTTPINPSCLEEYCEEVMGSFITESVLSTIEKLKISLPRNESFDKSSKLKSPRKKDSNTNWFEFAEKGISRSTTADVPPPLPPKGVQKAWINFEDIPEKRKAPKRIQTIPSRSYIEVPESVLQDSVLYNYVNPDECKCECHELNSREQHNEESQGAMQEDELPLLGDDNHEDEKNGLGSSERLRLEASECRSVISDSSVDLSTSIDPLDAGCKEQSLRTPFTSDLGVSNNKSNIVSQVEKFPNSPNAFPKTT